MRLRSTVVMALVGLLCAPLLAQKKSAPEADSVLSDEEYQKRFEKHFKSKPGYRRWYKSLEAGQIKINRIDSSEAPLLKIHASIVRGSKEGVLKALEDWEQVKRLTVKLSTKGARKPKALVTFHRGVVPEPKPGTPDDELPPFAEIVPIDKAKIPLDVVVVAAGHSRLKAVDGLESIHKSAVQSVLKGLGTAGTNIYWYGPQLYTYRSFEGIEGELSRFDENLLDCELERKKLLLKPAGDEGEKEATAPCGLHKQSGKLLSKAVKNMRYRGKHARLFGLPGVKPCTELEETSTAIRFFDTGTVAEQTRDTGAFEEALRLLLRYSSHDHRKAIIILSDGRDGYFDDEEQCRSYFRRYKECRKKWGAAAKKCAQKYLDQRATELQTQFSVRAQKWLALLRASGIRVFAVGYGMHRTNGQPFTHDYERERLELLAQKTGGTYREVTSTKMVVPAAEATVQELLTEHVITVDAGLVANSEYRVSLEARTNQTLITSPRIKFAVGEIPSGFMHWVRTKAKWLKDKVGSILFWVIMVVLAILLLVILWFVLKLLKGMGKGIFKLFKKLFRLGKKSQSIKGGR